MVGVVAVVVVVVAVVVVVVVVVVVFVVVVPSFAPSLKEIVIWKLLSCAFE